MSNRNFDASWVTRRNRDKNVAQQIYGAMQNGLAIGNPMTVNTKTSLITQYYPGVETSTEKNLRPGYSFNLGGIANYVDSVSITPTVSIPDTPVITGAVEGNLSATISFTISSDGGSPITLYEYFGTNGLNWIPFTPTSNTFTISGLSVGFSYVIKIRATNSIGTSNESNTITINGRTTPGAPTNLVGTSSSGQASITFTAGSTGNSTITNYQYSLDDGTSWNARSPASASSPIVITGLTNGQTYRIKLRAVNAIGEGTASSALLITPLPGSGLVLFLDAANYTSGSLWPESSGKSKNATLFNSPTWSSSNGGIFTFNGTNQYASIPAETVDFSAGITILSFVDFGNTNTWERIIDFGNGEGSENILLSRQSSTNNLVFQIFSGSTASIELSSGITNSAWGFYGSKADGNNIKIFNQTNSNTITNSTKPSSVSRSNNYIGRSNWSADAYFQRYMGIVAIYNTALSDADITAFYNLYKNRYSL